PALSLLTARDLHIAAALKPSRAFPRQAAVAFANDGLLARFDAIEETARPPDPSPKRTAKPETAVTCDVVAARIIKFGHTSIEAQEAARDDRWSVEITRCLRTSNTWDEGVHAPRS